jgi:TRAP-type C4-dicarboxylate transport system permease small subunit
MPEPVMSETVAAPVPQREPAATLLRALALAGGMLLFAMSLLVVANVTLRGAANSSIDGVFDLVKIGAALCVFLFLPLCQARRGNIMVDTFTAALPARWRNRLDALWDMVYAAIVGFMAVAMMQGTREQFSNHVQTTQLSIPIWPFNGAAAILLLILALVSFATAFRLLKTPQ